MPLVTGSRCMPRRGQRESPRWVWHVVSRCQVALGGGGGAVRAHPKDGCSPSLMHAFALGRARRGFAPACDSRPPDALPRRQTRREGDNLGVNTQDHSGITPLWSAARQGRLDLVRYLLRERADPDIAAHSGLGPLHTAAQQGCAWARSGGPAPPGLGRHAWKMPLPIKASRR